METKYFLSVVSGLLLLLSVACLIMPDLGGALVSALIGIGVAILSKE